MEINGYILENREKLQRVFALFKKEEKNINDHELVLAYYDREAGLIKKEGININTGMFWDFEIGKAKCEIEREKGRKLKEGAEKFRKEKIEESKRFWSSRMKIIIIFLGILFGSSAIHYIIRIQNNINGNNIGTQINNYSK